MDGPVPQTGSMLELQFLRLLSKLERIVVELDVHSRQSPLKFHSYVDALQEQLADLQNSQLSHLSAETLETYQQRVQLVVHQLGPASPPSFCRPINKHEVAMEKALQASSIALNGTILADGTTNPSRVASNSSSSRAPSQEPAADIVLSANTKQSVLRNRKLQEELLDELADMAGALKSGAQAMQGAAHRRGEVLEGTGSALETSAHNAKVNAAKAKQQYVRGRGSCCLTCMVFTIVALVFVNMLIYIKVSSYWQPARAASPARPPTLPPAAAALEL